MLLVHIVLIGRYRVPAQVEFSVPQNILQGVTQKYSVMENECRRLREAPVREKIEYSSANIRFPGIWE
jgi:hypothetical protein